MNGHSNHLPRLNYGCKIECLHMFKLTSISILGSIISGLTLEIGETNTTLFKALEEVLQEERESDHT